MRIASNGSRRVSGCRDGFGGAGDVVAGAGCCVARGCDGADLGVVDCEGRKLYACFLDRYKFVLVDIDSHGCFTGCDYVFNVGSSVASLIEEARKSIGVKKIYKFNTRKDLYKWLSK